MSTVKLTRRQVVSYRTNYPRWTMGKIAESTTPRITVERVRQILNDEGLPTKGDRSIECLGCNVRYPYRSLLSLNGQLCKDCRYAKVHRKVFCETCGKDKDITLTAYRRGMGYYDPRYKGKFFCDRVCLGIRAGREFGFRAHPENTNTKMKGNGIRKAQAGDLVSFQNNSTYSPHFLHVAIITAYNESKHNDGNVWPSGPTYSVFCECGKNLMPISRAFEVIEKGCI